ncbi:MAG: hypothetical protein ACOC2H_09795 [Spirochaetota bacterium]
MSIHLQNGLLELTLDLPGENYTSSRFDWTGKISDVRYDGIRITTCETGDYSLVKDKGRGFYNEFGIDRTPGFSEAPMGGLYHKIGVGKLVKDEEEYDFFRSHTIRPVSMTHESDDESVRLTCSGDDAQSFAYILTKTIRLKEDGFTIQYRLENSGSKTIETSEYCHNFLAVNDEPMGPDYELRFDFDLNTNLAETVNPDGAVRPGDRTITFEKGTDSQFFFSSLCPPDGVPAGWTLVNSKHGLVISEEGSFATRKINLWGWKHVISPELFYDITLAPGDTGEWSRTYSIRRV